MDVWESGRVGSGVRRIYICLLRRRHVPMVVVALELWCRWDGIDAETKRQVCI